MSAYIVSKSDDAFHLFTDGGVFANDGTLYAKTQKTYMLAHMPAAMTVIGSRAWGLILYPDLCMCHTLDHFLDNAEERLRNYLPAVTTVVEKERSTTEFAPIIAGYSERHDRMVCFVIGNHQKSELSKPWKLREITEDSMNPAPSQEALAALRPADDFILPRDGALIMQAQRNTLFPVFSEGAPGCGVGGFIQLYLI